MDFSEKIDAIDFVISALREQEQELDSSVVRLQAGISRLGDQVEKLGSNLQAFGSLLNHMESRLNYAEKMFMVDRLSRERAR